MRPWQASTAPRSTPFGRSPQTPDEPAFTGPDFRAHVTVKRNARVHEGDALILPQVAVVDMAPRSGPSG